MRNLRPLIPLLAAGGILLAGNGILGTLIALRAAEEGFAPVLIGLAGTAYFLGFLIACVRVPRLVARVGHIRVFAGLAAIASASTLMLVLVVDPYAWMALRFLAGFCLSGLFTVVESWLAEASTNQDRGRVLSVYRLIDLTTVTGVQFLLPVFGAGGFALFAITAMLLALSLVPISLTDASRPSLPASGRFEISTIWRISPLACLGVVTIGLTNSAFRFIGPLYARQMGLDEAGVALFIAAGVLGGAGLQMPFGWLSDRFDRRWVLVLATAGAAAAGAFLTVMAGAGEAAIYLGAFAFGAFALPLYSLSVAHAMDFAKKGQFLLVAAGLMFLFACGASVGPFAASVVIERFGAPAFFAYTSLVHIALIVAALIRMAQRPAPPAARRGRFIGLLRTSPFLARLGRRARERKAEAVGQHPSSQR